MSKSLRIVACLSGVLAFGAGALGCRGAAPSSSAGGHGGSLTDSGTGGGGGGAPGAGGGAGLGGRPGAGGSGGGTVAEDSVLMHHKNLSRDGLYVQPALTKAAAAGLHKDSTFVTSAVQGQVFAQPLFLDGGGSGPDLVIVATQGNNVYAFNGATGALVWMRNLGAPVPLSAMPCGNIDPYGITGTPVIDRASRTLFVDGITTPDGGTTKKHLIFALAVDTGLVETGWPVDVNVSVSSGTTTFTSSTQSQRGALAIVNGALYVSYGGLFGDCGTYHGWLVSVSLADPTQVQAWATAARGGGIWGPSGVASDGTNLFVTTGNTFGATAWGGGEGLLRFVPGASFATPTYWAPTNWLPLDNADADVGGTGPVLGTVAGATPSAIAVALGKDGNAYLVDRNTPGGIGNPVSMFRASTGAIITAAALYTTAQGTRVAFRGAGASCTNAAGTLTTLKIVAGAPPTFMGSWCGNPSGNGSPIVTTSDGQADAIVWALGAEGDNLLHGLDGDTGASIFGGGGVTISGLHRFNAPIAAKGRIFVAADSGVTVFTP
jgi:hypothetical protein